MADGYAGYNEACRINHITQLGCWDHARRKFKEAVDAQPKPKKGKVYKASKADYLLRLINKLYRIEREIKELSAFLIPPKGHKPARFTTA